MNIVITEIYENESPQTYIINTNLAKGKIQKIITNYLETCPDDTSIPYDEIMVGVGGMLEKFIIQPPVMVDKIITVYENEKISYKNWIKTLKEQNSITKPIDLTNLFFSSKAILPDGTPMQCGIMSKVSYEAIAMKNIVDISTGLTVIKAGDKCKAVFMGYSKPNQIGMFFNDYSIGANANFYLAPLNTKNAFSDRVFTEGFALYGDDFRLVK